MEPLTPFLTALGSPSVLLPASRSVEMRLWNGLSVTAAETELQEKATHAPRVLVWCESEDDA